MNTPLRAAGPASSLLAVALTAVLFAACQASASSPALSPTPAGATASAEAALPTPPGTGIVGGAFVAPLEACAGPREWTGVPAIIVRLADAWHEHDFAKRRAILDEVWTEDSLYQDPYGDPEVGRDALARLMGYGVAPGQYIELTTWDPSDMQHGAIRMAWRHCCPSGISLLEGVDLATLGSDGRIDQIVSFWSRYVEGPAEGACDGPRLTSTPSTAPSGDPATASCKGPDVDWGAFLAVGQGYGKAWNERDPAARRALLDEVWAEDGTFADQTYETPIVGREAFAHEIGVFQDAGFGAYFEPRPMAFEDAHNGHVRLPWTYCDADGNVVWVGEDIADLDAEGRLQRVLSFFAF